MNILYCTVLMERNTNQLELLFFFHTFDNCLHQQGLLNIDEILNANFTSLLQKLSV